MTAKPKPYYHLVQRTAVGYPWQPQWGDYTLSYVKEEMQTYRDEGIRASNLKIITAQNDTQAELTTLLSKLNK